MSGLVLNCIQADENEFIAKESLIGIVSNFDHPTFQFISGQFGPFVSQIPTTVPIWLAISLKQKGMCTIVAPQWMNIKELEKIANNERTQKLLGMLPFHYMEIAHLLLAYARDDIESPDQVAVLLQDIENIRMDRIKSGISSVAATVSKNQSVILANLNNSSAMEIYSIKRFFLSSMGTFNRLIPPETSADDGDSGTIYERNESPRAGLRKFREN